MADVQDNAQKQIEDKNCRVKLNEPCLRRRRNHGKTTVTNGIIKKKTKTSN